MTNEVPPCLTTLPVELIYRILDQLDELIILTSVRNVCKRFNVITDSYYRYQVMFSWVTIAHVVYLILYRRLLKWIYRIKDWTIELYEISPMHCKQIQ